MSKKTNQGRSELRHDGLAPYLFIAPLVVGVAVFYLWPVLQTFFMSLHTYGPFGGGEFNGLQNYEQIVSDGRFPRALLNTTIYTVIVLCSIPLSLLFAALIARPGMRFVPLFQILYFLPYLAMPTAISFVFRMIFNGDFGFANYLLGLVGIQGPYWLSTEWFALLALGIMGLWSSMGFNVLILSAGLKAIPVEYYEAAEIDGASKLRQFFSITIPLASPSIFLVTIMGVISSFQVFDTLFALLGTNNPVMGKTRSIVYLFYEQAFLQSDRGYAAAVAILIMLLIGVLTAFQFGVRKKLEDR